MRFQIWKSNDGDLIKVEVYEPVINCIELKLPVMPNYNDNSEQSIIQLKEIYDNYINFMLREINIKGEDTIGSKFELLPYTVVNKLNKMSDMLYDYLAAVGVHKFLPVYGTDINMDPMSSTPSCQYAFDAFKNARNKIDDFLSDRGLHIVIGKCEDTDFGVEG